MEKFLEKFNIFDLFTLLIPGIIISILYVISLAFEYCSIWAGWGSEKYVGFFALSFFTGVFFQELGDVFDRKFLHKILYGGNPREIFLLKDGHEKILNEQIFYDEALCIKNYLVKKLNINIHESQSIEEEKNLNALIFGYCLNISENKNLAGKSEKMGVISEMSRSLFWGCISVIILNMYMIFQYSCYFDYYIVEIFLLFLASYFLLHRKKRYEKYRIRILLRSFYLYIKLVVE